MVREMKLSDIKDPAQRAMFAKAAGLACPGILPMKPGVMKQTPPGSWIENATPSMKLLAPKESPLERLFLELWEKCGGVELEREVELVQGYKFRCDFVHELSKLVIEIQGARDHTSIKGFHRDNFKHLELAKLGYRVITLDRKLINETNIKFLVGMVAK